jgi:amino acid adenylation domain-containing protein
MPCDKPGLCIQELFERQARRTPDAAALTLAERSVSYRDLNARANKLARHLRRLGVAPDDRVALCAQRSVELVVGLLAIIKSGGAYLPLDHAQPVARLRQMMRDGEPVAIVAAGDARATAAMLCAALQPRPTSIDLDRQADSWADNSQTDLAPASIGLNENHLAYLIYTSGSTGAPKGVMVEHGNVVSYLRSIGDLLKLGPGDVVAATTTIGFDIAVTELLAPLAHGATILMLDQLTLANAAEICVSARRANVSLLQFTPSAWRMMLSSGEALPRRRLISGGEALDGALAARLLKCSDEVWNLYGPTETTVWSTADRVEKNRIAGPHAPPMGSPLSNTRIYLLDESGNTVDGSGVGEIYIAGAGVARGYFRQPDMTAARFLEDPFAPGRRMYRTGDLGRFLPDGGIEYLGRVDRQVKIRGVRVEIGEIDAHLLAHPAIKEAAVIAVNDDPRGKRLAAYIVSPTALNHAGLVAYLKNRLPEQMIPTVFVQLDQFPLTPNGKRDLRQLPAPDFAAAAAPAEPLDPLEQALAQIWCELLGLKRVGRRDNFFDLGGNSLMVLMLLSRVRDGMGAPLSLESLFSAPTLADLADQIKNASATVEARA